MKSIPANCPAWLEKKIIEMGGSISFYDYMNIVLNDAENGYYGSGKAEIGAKGDFVTSPSLSNDFAFLLAKQIEDWSIEIFNKVNTKNKLIILEFGAGDGSLIKGIIEYYLKTNIKILKRISFKIFELNKGMLAKQNRLLNNFLNEGIDITWTNLKEFEKKNFDGIVLAHEVLDAFPVERIQYSNGHLFQQLVSIDKDKRLFFQKRALSKGLKKRIDFIENSLGIKIPPVNAPEEWTNELHVDNYQWLKNIYESLNNGILLVIDYSLEGKRFYSSSKIDGNIVSYNKQQLNNNILKDSGNCDLTTHICSEILINDAELVGYRFEGLVKQGEALLKLGLAEMIYELQTKYKDDLSQALFKREALLRLVDPICLGDFKWFIFQKTKLKDIKFRTKILID